MKNNCEIRCNCGREKQPLKQVSDAINIDRPYSYKLVQDRPKEGVIYVTTFYRTKIGFARTIEIKPVKEYGRYL